MFVLETNTRQARPPKHSITRGEIHPEERKVDEKGCMHVFGEDYVLADCIATYLPYFFWSLFPILHKCREKKRKEKKNTSEMLEGITRRKAGLHM